MNTQKHVRLLRGWQHYSKGHVFTSMPAAQAQYMVAAGQCEYVTKDFPAAPVDRMMRSEGKPDKRRPVMTLNRGQAR